MHFNGSEEYKTQVKERTLNPSWNESFKIQTEHTSESTLSFQIFDYDLLSDDDNMGSVTVLLPDYTSVSAVAPSTEWYKVEGRKAKGELQIQIAVSVRKLLNVKRGNSKELNGKIQLKLNWEMEGITTDLDTSCVAIDSFGNILMDETVYFGDTVNSNGSIKHSGDALAGGGNGEVITCELNRIKQHVCALYFILSVATPGRTFEDVESSEVLVRDVSSGIDVCRFVPTFAGKHTSMFLMRLARVRNQGGGGGHGPWKMTIIEDTDRTGEFASRLDILLF